MIDLTLKMPTEAEILKIIEDGALCPQCNKNPAEITDILGIPAVGPCKDCQIKMWEAAKNAKPDNSMGSNRVASVFVHEETGSLIPVNERGNVIKVDPKYEKKKGERPLW